MEIAAPAPMFELQEVGLFKWVDDLNGEHNIRVRPTVPERFAVQWEYLMEGRKLDRAYFEQVLPELERNCRSYIESTDMNNSAFSWLVNFVRNMFGAETSEELAAEFVVRLCANLSGMSPGFCFFFEHNKPLDLQRCADSTIPVYFDNALEYILGQLSNTAVLPDDECEQRAQDMNLFYRRRSETIESSKLTAAIAVTTLINQIVTVVTDLGEGKKLNSAEIMQTLTQLLNKLSERSVTTYDDTIFETYKAVELAEDGRSVKYVATVHTKITLKIKNVKKLCCSSYWSHHEIIHMAKTYRSYDQIIGTCRAFGANENEHGWLGANPPPAGP